METYIPNTGDIRPNVGSVLLELFRTAIGAINPAADIVYYPCCSCDTTPSAAFPNARVIYADRDGATMEALRAHGFEAHTTDATAFRPIDAVDIVVMLNPTIAPDGPLSALRPGGYLLCNDYHGTARDVRELPTFTLMGVAEYENTFDTESLDDYWTAVQTDEELAAKGHYADSIRRVVEKYDSVEGGVLAGYARLYEKAYRVEFQQQTRFAAMMPGITGPNEGDDLGPLFVDPCETQSLLPPLPRKKGHADCLFVFKKG